MTIPSTRDRLLATYNVANRIQNHCRIVNVEWKQPRVSVAPKTFPADSWWDILGDQRTGVSPRWHQPLVIGSQTTDNGRFGTSPSCAPIDARTLGNC